MFSNNNKEHKSLSEDLINILFQKLLWYEMYFYG